MHLTFRNVNEAFYGLVLGIHKNTIPTRRSPSRVGDVIVVNEPVTVTYTHPRERVLFNQARDCNPFFHLFESLWMLAGRNDVAPLVYYNPKMADYSDDGKTLHGAYGYRWQWCRVDDNMCPGSWGKRAELRKGYGQETWIDQLLLIVKDLQSTQDSRRCVLAMWNAEDDLLSIGDSKDVPCNTHAYFSVCNKRLDMTVCNRSNDLIWGMLGANVVHFSFLQEYLAACIGVDVGVYNQFTNNLHVYEKNWEPEKWLEEKPFNYYGHGSSVYPSLVQDSARFDKECAAFVDSIDGDFQEPFLRSVAQPMCAAFRQHKKRNYRDDNNALRIMERVWSGDWRIAGENWIKKRQTAWEDRNPYVERELER